jgi:putative cell wall-binding protein
LIYPQGGPDGTSAFANEMFSGLFDDDTALTTVQADFSIDAHTYAMAAVGDYFCADMFSGDQAMTFAPGCAFNLPQGLTSVGAQFCADMFNWSSGDIFAKDEVFNLPSRLQSVGNGFCEGMFSYSASGSDGSTTANAVFNLPQELTTVPDDFCEDMFEWSGGSGFNMNPTFNLPPHLTSVGDDFCQEMFHEFGADDFNMNAIFNLPQNLTSVGEDFCALMFDTEGGLADAPFTMNQVFNLPQRLTTVGDGFCKYMFDTCKCDPFNMNSVFNLPTALTSVGDDFCAGLFFNCCGSSFQMNQVFNLPQHLTTVGSDFCGSLFDTCDNPTFTMNAVFNIPAGITSVGSSFCSSMFNYCDGAAFTMNKVFSLPQGIANANDRFCGGMFTSCSGAAFTMNSLFNLPQHITAVGSEFCQTMFDGCSGAAFTMNSVFNLPPSIATVGSAFCADMFEACTGKAFNISPHFNLPEHITTTDSTILSDFCDFMFLNDKFQLPAYVPGKPYAQALRQDWGNDGSMTVQLNKVLNPDTSQTYNGWSVKQGRGGSYASVSGTAPAAGELDFQVSILSNTNPGVILQNPVVYQNPNLCGAIYYALPGKAPAAPTVPTIGGGVDTASVKTPAAVVMGGAGSTYSTANDGQGVSLSLTTPVITSDGGAAVTQKGWLISKATSKPATSTLGARSYNSTYWQPFNPSTYMALGDNGKYLVYYAENSVGYGYSNEVKVSVSADYPYPEVGGSNRLATSATTALDAWPSGVSKAVFVSGAEFYDAECANYLAGVLGCPILLVSATTSSNVPIKQAVSKLGIKSAYVVGGNCTASMMRSVGFSHYARVSTGRDGATDAVQVLQYVVSHKLEAKPQSLLLSTTSGFADALGASSYSATKALDLPILFVNGLNDATKAAAEVKSLGSIKNLYVLGSTGAVSASAAKKVQSSCAKGVKATRLWGSDRNQTAAAVFSYFAPKVATLNPSKHLNSIGVAAGNNYPDALGAGAAQAHLGGAVLITPATSVAPWISRELTGGTITISGSKATYKLASLVKTLTNFEFYGQTISLKVRQAISKYVR